MKSGLFPTAFVLLTSSVLLSFFPFPAQSKKHPSKTQMTSAPREIPMFRPLRRSIKNFIPSRTAFITIVFQSSVMPRVRWFRQLEPHKKDANKKLLPNAEFPNMINIRVNGDPTYRVRVISSHDVTAVTLVIGGVGQHFPVKIVTCFSIDSAQFQYQLDTHIDSITESTSDYLDGILWTVIPERIISFNALGQLTVSCAARLESESSRFTDELNIYRSYLERNQQNGTVQVSSVGTGKIHKERDNYVEESGKYLYRGNREVIAKSKRKTNFLYEVSFNVLNGSQDDVGVYTCAAERAKDRTYISSLVKVQQQEKPVLIVLPCGEEPARYPAAAAAGGGHHSGHESRTVAIRLTEHEPNCIRCRIFDYETAWIVDDNPEEKRSTGPKRQMHTEEKKMITLKKGKDVIDRSTDNILLDWHLNVADGGLTELTITFLHPTKADQGSYQCEARNSLGSDTASFHVTVHP